MPSMTARRKSRVCRMLSRAAFWMTELRQVSTPIIACRVSTPASRKVPAMGRSGAFATTPSVRHSTKAE